MHAYSNSTGGVRVNLDNLTKQAKLLVRWHREGNYSVGGRIRQLPRYRELTDVQILELKFPLREGQEVIALEAGYASWAELKAVVDTLPKKASPSPATPALKRAIPVVFVSNVQVSAEFYRDKLGFAIDFLHGHPPFYGSVIRDAACIHLRFVHEPAFASGLREREGLLSAFLAVDNVKGLFAEYKVADVGFVQLLKKEPWGGSAFIVRDPDGNWICFAG
ncbi:MAG: VOC family protein [Acidobacteriota bacterium]|nr:VOC family protein [Acidobacteriota bacterium]